MISLVDKGRLKKSEIVRQGASLSPRGNKSVVYYGTHLYVMAHICMLWHTSVCYGTHLYVMAHISI